MKNSAKSKRKYSLSSKSKKILTYIFAVAVVILLVMTAAQKLGNVTVATFTSEVKTYFMSLGSGDGYPYEVKADSVKNIIVNNSNLEVLTDDKTLVLTSSAKELQPKIHSYSDPAMKAKGSKIIVYDLGSGRFRVQNDTEIIKEHSLEKSITAAAIGQKGNYAVASYDENSQAVIYAYSKGGEQSFSRAFKGERIIDIDLSSNGKYIAAAAISAVNGEMTSKLYVFNLKDSENYISCFEYPGTTLLRVNYVKGNNIVTLGSNIRSYIKNNTEKIEDIAFESDKPGSYSVASNGSSALMLSKYGSTSLSQLTFYTNKNKVKFTQDFDREVKAVSTDGKYTAVLLDGEVRTFNKKGKQVGTIYFNGDPRRVIVDGVTTYVLTSVNILSFDTKGTTDERQADK